MDDIKIKNFLKENPGRQFPWFRPLLRSEERELYIKLCNTLKLPSNTSWKELILEVDRRQTHLGNYNFECPEHGSKVFSAKLKADKETKVYIWSLMFDNLDEMCLSDIVDIFGYIWYESAEDVYVISTEFKWLITVTHYGAVGEIAFG